MSDESKTATGEDEEFIELHHLRITVDSIEGPSFCGLEVGDYFEVAGDDTVSIPEGKRFCMFAMQAVFPLIPAKHRVLAANDWIEKDSLVCCPDPEERVTMRIERVGSERYRADDLS